MIASTAVRLAQARLAVTPLAKYPGPLPRDLEEAYECQQAALAHWPAGIVGWKVARIGPQWQGQFPEERLIGPILEGRLYRQVPGRLTQCPIIDGGFAAIEAEIGVFVATDAPADRVDWTSESAASLIGQICVGAEVASSPLPPINDLGPAAIISDFGNNWGAIAGATLTDLTGALDVTTLIDDSVVGHAKVVISETPLAAFAFALNKAARLGRPLRAGQYISTGMITGVHDIRVGQRARLEFSPGGNHETGENRGEIECVMVRSLPSSARGTAQ
jgi:2-keto-4-pentenoate hydratase